MKDLLTHVLGGRKGAGGSIVRVAEQTRDLPAVRDALTAGEISLAQAGVIGRRTTTLPRVPQLRQDAAAVMLGQVADHGYDATDLDRAFGEVISQIDPDGTLLRADLDKPRAERGAHHARYLSLTPDDLGGVWVKGYGTVEDAELIKSTLLPLAAPVTTTPGACGGRSARTADGDRDPDGPRPCPDPACAHDGNDPRDAGARLWDALVDACRRLQATDDLPLAHATTARITLTLSLAELQAQLQTPGGAGLLGSGERLSAQAARRLACDAEIIPAVLGTHSQVLDVGRSQRLVTPGLWSALVLRDRHCAFPGCTRLPLACDAHHLQHWADGGTTSLDNLILLCRHHHTLTHHSPWQVHLDPVSRRPVWTPPPTARRAPHPSTRPRPPLVA